MTTDQLRAALTELCARMPQSVMRSGLGKSWVVQRKAALRLLDKETVSDHELRCAVSAMERYE